MRVEDIEARLERDGATIKIDQVRNAVKRLRYEPVVGAIKGLIVDAADLLREEAVAWQKTPWSFALA